MSTTASTILDSFHVFRKLPESERVRASEATRLVRLPDRALFYRQGQTMDHFGLVGSGSLRVYRASESGREITLYHVGAGDTCLVNLLGVLLRQEAYAAAQARGPVTAALVPGDLVRSWIRSIEAFQDFAFDMVGRRLLAAMTLVDEIAFRKVDQRLAEYLRRRAADDSRITTTHEEIACELGTAREVVSRLLESFAQQGAIVLGRGHIRVKDLDRLLRGPPDVTVTKSQTAARRGR